MTRHQALTLSNFIDVAVAMVWVLLAAASWMGRWAPSMSDVYMLCAFNYARVVLLAVQQPTRASSPSS